MYTVEDCPLRVRPDGLMRMEEKLSALEELIEKKKDELDELQDLILELEDKKTTLEYEIRCAYPYSYEA